MGIAVAERIAYAHPALVPDLPPAGAQPDAAACPSGFGQLGGSARRGVAASAQQAARAGFAADSTDGPGEPQPPDGGTPQCSTLAAGDAGSPSGAQTPSSAAATAAAPVAAASAKRRQPQSHSAAKQRMMRGFLQPKQAQAPGSSGAASQPALSASRPPLATLAGRSSPMAAAGGAPEPCTPRVSSPAAGGSRQAAAGEPAGSAVSSLAGAADTAASPAAAPGLQGAAAADTGVAAAQASASQPQPAQTPLAGSHPSMPRQHDGRQQSQQQQQLGGCRLAVDWRIQARARCGVRVIWVSPKARRCGIAGKLLDAVR